MTQQSSLSDRTSVTEAAAGATPAAPSDEPRDAKRKFDLSLSSLTAGSLAAITAAALGAQLGVAGTIIGAGVGSLISAVATAIFRVSLQDGRARLREAYDRAAQLRTRGDLLASSGDRGASVMTGGPHVPAATGDSDPTAQRPADEPVDEEQRIPLRKRNRIPASRWRLVLLGAAATFLVALGLITAYEAIAGQTLSGERGTSITRVVNDGPDGGETPTDVPQNPDGPASGTTAPPSGPTGGRSEPAPTTAPPASPTARTEQPAPEPTTPAPQAPSPAPEPQAAPAATASDGAA